MRCYQPITVTVKAYGRVFKDLQLPCGKCAACLHKRAVHWQFRLREELKDASSCYFVTLTYSDENLIFADVDRPDVPSGTCVPVVNKRDCQLFLKRLRKRLEGFNCKIRYYLVSEYGPRTGRPHYHAIIFNIPKELNAEKLISQSWSKGFVSVSNITNGRINYVTKYCLKNYEDIKNQFVINGSEIIPNFVLCSKRPFLGHRYLEACLRKAETQDIDSITALQDGYYIGLPRIYRTKLLQRLYIEPQYERVCKNAEFLDYSVEDGERHPIIRPATMDAWQEIPYGTGEGLRFVDWLERDALENPYLESQIQRAKFTEDGVIGELTEFEMKRDNLKQKVKRNYLKNRKL